MIPASIIERVREATDLRELALEYGPGIRMGDSVLMKCLYHREDTASLRIHEHYFFCFGCQKSGSPFDWLESLNGSGFRENLSFLAERAGIDLSNFNIKPLPLTKINYAREEKAISDWWWVRKLEWLHDLGARELAREDADMKLVSDLFKLNMWVRERSKQDTGWPKDAGAKGVSPRYAWFAENVKPEDREEYKRGVVADKAFAAAWLGLAESLESEAA